jgi:hypothetical protein
MRSSQAGRLKLIALLVASLMMPACSDTNLRKVFQAINVFHARFNAGQFSEIYRDADPQFRASISEADFVAKLERLRQEHGAIRESGVNGLEHMTRFHRWFPNSRKVRFIGFYNHCEKGGFQEFFSWDVSGTEASLQFYENDIATVNRNSQQQ